MPFIPFALLLAMSWGLYLISRKLLGRVSFEIETFGFLLSGVGIMLLCAEDFSLIYVQMGSMLLGLCLFGFFNLVYGRFKTCYEGTIMDSHCRNCIVCCKLSHRYRSKRF